MTSEVMNSAAVLDLPNPRPASISQIRQSDRVSADR
jgi:hypothetical protein